MTKYSKNLLPGRPKGVTSYQQKPAKAFGMVLRRVRTDKNLSQEELGQLAEIPRNHIGNIERGENLPTLGMVFKLARALGVSAGEMVTEAEQLLLELESSETEG